MSDLMVTGGAIDNWVGAKIPCRTKRKVPTLFPSLMTYSQSSPPENPSRTKKNLEDGVYGYNIAECFLCFEANKKPFLVLDFGQLARVQRVALRSQLGGDILNKFRNIFLRLGNESRQGDFESYTFYDAFLGLPVANTDFTFENDEAQIGRFLSIQSVNYSSLQFCSLEVFGELL
jgi:hypothetical protein